MEAKETVVTIDDKKYKYITGQALAWLCTSCALVERCSAREGSYCEDFGLEDDTTGNFQLAEGGDAAEATTGNGRMIDEETYKELVRLGILGSDVRSYNRGNSDYSCHLIQPWSIWIEYELNAWDADIVKRVLRTKEGESRALDYEKIIHDCQERLRQLMAAPTLPSPEVKGETTHNSPNFPL